MTLLQIIVMIILYNSKMKFVDGCDKISNIVLKIFTSVTFLLKKAIINKW